MSSGVAGNGQAQPCGPANRHGASVRDTRLPLPSVAHCTSYVVCRESCVTSAFRERLLALCIRRQRAAEEEGHADFILSVRDACIDLGLDPDRARERMKVWRWLAGTAEQPGRLVREGLLTVVKRGRQGPRSEQANVYRLEEPAP